MALRKQSGGTLSLVVISTFVLVLIGACFFLIARIIGGAREAQHATDSGGLNVAQRAIKFPGHTLAAGGDEINFQSLKDPVTGEVNLEVYNHLVGRSLLVAINASADGNATGLANANRLVNALQGPNGVGAGLSQKLGVGSPSGGALNGFFSDLAGQNPTRMLGTGSLAEQGVTAAYMEQRLAGDPNAANVVGATNLLKPAPQQMPIMASGSAYQFPDAWLTQDRRITGVDYVRGYAGMNVAGINMPIVGVPVQPRHQARLASQADFDKGRTRPVAGVNVPPNSFRSAAATREDKSQGNVNTIACALVGVVDAQQAPPQPSGYFATMPGKEFRPSIPDGFIRIINAAGNAAPAGTNPAAFNLFDDELDPSIGVKVGGSGNGKHMTSTDGLLEQWDRYNRAMAADPSTAGQQPPLTDLYQADGSPATAASAGRIRLNQQGSPDTVCTDRNTYQPLQQPGFPPENAECRQLLDSGAMDAAFSGDGPYTNPSGPSQDLMAMEEVKCRVIDRFNEPGGIDTTLPTATGLRLWDPPIPGVGRPWLAGNGRQRCQVSGDGTLCELIAQAADASNPGSQAGNTAARTVRDFIRQRACEIYAEANLSDVDDVVGWPMSAGANGWRSNDRTNKLPLSNQPYFIYFDFTQLTQDPQNPNQRNPKCVLSQNLANNTPLAWRTQPADGTPGGPNGQWKFQSRYQNMDNGTMMIVNPRYEADIHDRLFQCQSGEVTAEDFAQVTPSCGFRNILGEVTLQNRVISFQNGASMGQSPQFSCPN